MTEKGSRLLRMKISCFMIAPMSLYGRNLIKIFFDGDGIMTCYAYLHADSRDVDGDLKAIRAYAKQKKFNIDAVFTDEVSTKVHWNERKIGEFLIRVAQTDDILIIYEGANLTCSTSQMLELLSKAVDRKVQVHFVKYEASLLNDSDLVDTRDLLDLIGRVESDFISKRTTQALARRKAAGLPLGRPKGRGNKSLKLDRHKEDILKYLRLGISKASIAKLVDCHPQTLYDWLDRNDVGFKTTDKEREELQAEEVSGS